LAQETLVNKQIVRAVRSCGREALKRPALRIGLKYGLGLGLLAWVVSRYWVPADGTPGLADALHKHIHITPLLLAMGLGLVSILLTFVRWFVLVRALVLPFTCTDAFRLGFIGFFWNILIPGSVGGDVVKAAFIVRQQDRRTVAVATVLIDRLVGLCGLIWLVALLGGACWAGGWLPGLAASPQAVATLQAIMWGACLLAGGSLLFWLLLGCLPARRADIFAGRLTKIPKVGGSLAELWRAVWLYRCRGRSVGLALLLAVAGHVGFVLTFFFAARTLCPAQEMPSLGAHFVIVPLGMIIQAGFPAPGGVGGAEVAFGTLYNAVGAPFASGVLGSLVKLVVTWVLALAGYLVYLRMRPAVRRTALAEGADAELAVARAG
jgi:uncharacterized membrane protein YbhN (UPF0104 family)